MNELLDRTDPLVALRPQSARENERALAFALKLTPGRWRLACPALVTHLRRLPGAT